MAEHQQHIQMTDVDGVAVVRFLDRKITDELVIQELGDELFQLVEARNLKKILLNFTNVEFLSSAALGKLISLERKVDRAGGMLRLSNIRTEIYDVFVITRLNEKFVITDEQEDALADFASAE